MAFFRSTSFPETMPAIDGDRVVLRQPQMSDYPEWAALRERSRDFLKPWEPIWPADDLTRGAFRRRLKRYAEDQRADQSYSFFIALKPEGVLVGGITLANIRRGVAQAGSIGYWVGEPHARHGLMSAALARHHPVQLRHAAPAPAGGRLHPDQRRPRSGCWKNPGSSAKAMRGNTSASTGCGRTTCFMRASRTNRRIFGPAARSEA